MSMLNCTRPSAADRPGQRAPSSPASPPSSCPRDSAGRPTAPACAALEPEQPDGSRRLRARGRPMGRRSRRGGRPPAARPPPPTLPSPRSTLSVHFAAALAAAALAAAALAAALAAAALAAAALAAARRRRSLLPLSPPPLSPPPLSPPLAASALAAAALFFAAALAAGLLAAAGSSPPRASSPASSSPPSSSSPPLSSRPVRRSRFAAALFAAARRRSRRRLLLRGGLLLRRRSSPPPLSPPTSSPRPLSPFFAAALFFAAAASSPRRWLLPSPPTMGCSSSRLGGMNHFFATLHFPACNTFRLSPPPCFYSCRIDCAQRWSLRRHMQQTSRRAHRFTGGKTGLRLRECALVARRSSWDTAIAWPNNGALYSPLVGAAYKTIRKEWPQQSSRMKNELKIWVGYGNRIDAQQSRSILTAALEFNCQIKEASLIIEDLQLYINPNRTTLYITQSDGIRQIRSGEAIASVTFKSGTAW